MEDWLNPASFPRKNAAKASFCDERKERGGGVKKEKKGKKGENRRALLQEGRGSRLVSHIMEAGRTERGFRKKERKTKEEESHASVAVALVGPLKIESGGLFDVLEKGNHYWGGR